jgi:hypothetical protein
MRCPSRANPNAHWLPLVAKAHQSELITRKPYNFFIGPAGQWLGTYVPAALRDYLFRLARVEGAQDVGLCIDEDSGLVSSTLMEPPKTLSMLTATLLDLLLEIERKRVLTNLAVAALRDAGLIQPWLLSVKVAEKITPSMASSASTKWR